MLKDCIEGRDTKKLCEALRITEDELNNMVDYDFIPGGSLRKKMAFFLDKKQTELWPSLRAFKNGSTRWYRFLG